MIHIILTLIVYLVIATLILRLFTGHWFWVYQRPHEPWDDIPSQKFQDDLDDRREKMGLPRANIKVKASMQKKSKEEGK